LKEAKKIFFKIDFVNGTDNLEQTNNSINANIESVISFSESATNIIKLKHSHFSLKKKKEKEKIIMMMMISIGCEICFVIQVKKI
jgi:hypothetical protein